MNYLFKTFVYKIEQRKGRLRVKERIINAFKHYQNNIFDEVNKFLYGAAIFLQLNTIINFIDEVCNRFMRNFLGLGKGTSKSRYMQALANYYN